MRHGVCAPGYRILLLEVLSCWFLWLILAGQVAAETPGFANSSAFSSDSTQRLQNAVHRMNAWLNGSEHAESWRRMLLLNVLETQSARGEQADIGTLSTLNNLFVQHTGNLCIREFTDVQNALQMQIQNLSASYVGDLYTAVVTARGQYKPISIADMFYQRDIAVSELQHLRDYYRSTLSSRDRADLFHDIQLDPMLEFLGGINFELAPEISVGKMDSMIRGVQKQLKEVEKAIDAIPIVQGSDDVEEENDQANDDSKISEQGTGLELEVPPNLFGPEPDEGQRSADELQKEYQKLEDQIAKLKAQRSEIVKQDRDRQVERGKTFKQLRKFETTIAEVGKKRGDPYFVSAAATYERFVRTYFYGTSDNLQEDFLKRLEGLEANLLKIDGPNARAAAGEIGDACRWLENANQVPHLVTAIRARYSQPNFYAGVSAQLINQLGKQTTSESRCVRENVGGRLVRGSAQTSARVTIALQDDPNQVHASICLTGSVNSRTYVDQGKIRVFAGGRGRLAGHRSIYANIGGLFAGHPYVSANIRASLLGSSSKLCLVNRIVGRKFEEARGESEAITSRKAEDELLMKFREQTDQPIREGQNSLTKAQQKLIAKANLVPEIYARSLPNQVMVVGKKSTISTLAAQNLPMLNRVRTDVAVQVHDSMLSNFLDKTFSGKTFTDKELAKEIGELVGKEPDALAAKPGDEAQPEDESFSITFATVRPIQFEFEDNLFRVVVSGRRFSQGEKKINEGLKIILSFRIKRIDGKLKFVRDGKAQLEFLDDDYPAAAVAFKSFLDGKLNPKEGVEQISVDLPENLLPFEKVEALKDSELVKRLRLVQCRSENGWLYLGWVYQPDCGYWSWQYDTPAILNETTIIQMEPTYLYEATPINEPAPMLETVPGSLQLNSSPN